MSELILNISINGNKFWCKDHPKFKSISPVTYNPEWNKYSFDCCFHREDGPSIEWANGDKHWFINGERHRLDGPAIEYADGHKTWYRNGRRHREDGPAEEYVNGTVKWFYNGIKYNVNSAEELMIAVLLK